MQMSLTDVYKHNPGTRRLALVLNFAHFKEQDDDRPGSRQDLYKLRRLFNQPNHYTITHQDLTKQVNSNRVPTSITSKYEP